MQTALDATQYYEHHHEWRDVAPEVTCSTSKFYSCSCGAFKHVVDGYEYTNERVGEITECKSVRWVG